MSARRPRPIDVLRAARTADRLDWLFVTAWVVWAGALLAIAWLAGSGGVDAARAATTGPHGALTVRQCTKDDADDDPEFWSEGWDCDGSFRSDDGRVAIARVKVFTHARHRPGPQVPGRVSGPAAGWLTGDGDYSWLLALAIAVVLPVVAGKSLGAGISALEPPAGWPRPPKPPRTGPPQIGDRARRRRRKRRRSGEPGQGVARPASPDMTR